MPQENRTHFILSNRDIIAVGGHVYQLNVEHKIQPYNPIRYALYQFNEGLTEEDRPEVGVKKVEEGFLQQVFAEAEQLPEGVKNITLYIHGFHHVIKRSFKLDIMDGLISSYCNPDIKKRAVGKFIFFSWPATGSRKNVDDRAHAQGVKLYEKNIQLFEDLYDGLKQRGVQLNLMVHSFGHRILNGFLAKVKTDRKLFDNVFLFASDIPHECMENEGILLKNKGTDPYVGDVKDIDGKRLYQFKKLNDIANAVHCYYCNYDRMLMASADGEMGGSQEDKPEEVDNHLCLGTLGNTRLENAVNAMFYDVLKLMSEEDKLRTVLNEHPEIVKRMQAIIESGTFTDQQQFVFLKETREPWVQLHQYLFRTEAVTAHVKDILVPPQNPTEHTIA